ncbi:MAG: Fic family protein [Candidatus Nanoarchaeia archaeon]|nr:Fic family protein [Candidatus Nanoarchaeia archaeon]
MGYTEIQIKGKNKYYYRTKSIRQGKKVKKLRKYLGKNLNDNILKKLEEKIDIELEKPLSKLLSKEELKFLDRIKDNYKKNGKKDFQLKYESFISKFTYDSNAIEGSTLTLRETSSVLFDNISPEGKSPREINEAINHKKAFDFMIDYKGDIDKKFICTLQKIIITNTLKKELEDQTGIYRNCQVYIRGASFIPPKYFEVKKEMSNLIRWYNRNKNKLHPIIISAYFHSVFESIHPFVDGNGRTGRLLINFILHKNNFPMINISLKQRLDYYNSLEKARKGDLKDLIKLIMNLMSTPENII